MKNRFLVSILLGILLTYNSYGQQLQTIPDPNLRTFLISKFPECFSGELLDTSCYKVKGLVELDVSNLDISDLTGMKFFKNLRTLKCSNNNLTTLDEMLPDSLQTLYCDHNKLAALPELPDSLQVLECSGNMLTVLPSLPIKVEVLKCADNKLTQLPDLTNICSIIDADSNKLTSLPALPDSLYYLSVTNNELTVIPAISVSANKLAHLYVSYNKITTVPALPSSLKTFNVNDNQISELPALPSGLYSLGCSNNTISCLPFLPWGLKYLGFKGNPITCIPNMPLDLISFNGTTTIICNAQNTQTNNCTYYTPVKGTVYMDYNNNNIKDTDETGVPDILIKTLNESNQKTLTDEDGNFTLYLSQGTYVYRVDVSDTLFELPAARYIKVTDGVTNEASYDFPLTPVKEIKDLTVSCMPVSRPRPGFQTSYVITCANTGNYPISAAELSFLYASELTYESTSLDFLSHNDTILKWSLPVLYPGQKKNIGVVFSLPSTIPLGTVLSSRSVLKPLNSGDTTRNYYSLSQIVVGSYDPNDKNVFPSGNIKPEFVTEQKDLEYIIRFQNTGTAEAVNVVVLDTLSEKFNAETLVMISSSHKYRYEQRGNIVSWTFENINLPDMNTNEPESHGFVKFKIKPTEELGLGEVIRNKAGIVFDFNEPIITNQTETKIALTTSVIDKKASSQKIVLFPNPCSDNVYLSFHSKESLITANLIIRNSLNQHVLKKEISVRTGLNEVELNLGNLNEGIYYIELIYDGELHGEKLLKR